jgi:hypothetical protein
MIHIGPFDEGVTTVIKVTNHDVSQLQLLLAASDGGSQSILKTFFKIDDVDDFPSNFLDIKIPPKTTKSLKGKVVTLIFIHRYSMTFGSSVSQAYICTTRSWVAPAKMFRGLF